MRPSQSLNRTYNLKRSSRSQFPQPVLAAAGALPGLNWGKAFVLLLLFAQHWLGCCCLPVCSSLLRVCFGLLWLFRQRSESIVFPSKWRRK